MLTLSHSISLIELIRISNSNRPSSLYLIRSHLCLRTCVSVSFFFKEICIWNMSKKCVYSFILLSQFLHFKMHFYFSDCSQFSNAVEYINFKHCIFQFYMFDRVSFVCCHARQILLIGHEVNQDVEIIIYSFKMFAISQKQRKKATQY